MENLDALDYKILDALQSNNLASQKDIGNKIGLSAPAVQRRIKRLREIGAITKDIAVLNADYLGSPITIIVQVEMETDKIDQINKVKEHFRKTPQVQQCFYVTGETDFVLVIIVYTMKEYEMLTHELFFNNPAVKQFNTSIAMDVIKVGLSLPIPK
ncbi:MAG: Lrp/AsnC family transcriptional regulator [Flavobacteriales bacterium]|nr:MAG: Lrp/AsnC family transcriptional regulator [Flavobacteriales bacterium]